MKIDGNNLVLGPIIGSDKSLILPADCRAKHLYICGGTGAGKSKFLEHLIRQDILNWCRTRCGLLLIDPHGAVYDGLMAWLAKHAPTRPIIPIDFRQAESVCAYNLIRRRKASPAVIVDNLVDAMAHVWGAAGTDRTPLLARWSSNTLGALYEKGYTLAEAVHLTDPTASRVREAMTRDLIDPVARKDWAYANALSAKDFANQVSSTLNRLNRFIRNEYLRAIFGQSEVSLDLGEALEEGHIILVSLARKNALVSRENTDLFATLLLADLWQAAQERREKSENPKPFYVYLDEFQRFVSPTIGENLAESRGFGLHLTMAHQFPNQLVNRGPEGKALYDEVMENASTKVVFRLSYEENLRPLASALFMGSMDPDEVKHQLFATKVMGYREERRRIYGETSSRGRGSSRTNVATESTGDGGSEQFDPNLGLTLPFSGTLGPNDPLGEVRSWNAVASQAASEGEVENGSESESVTEVPVFLAEFGKELSSVQFRDLEEQLFRAMARLFSQEDRHCAVRLVGARAPVFTKTPEVLRGLHNPLHVKEYTERARGKWPFFLSIEQAVKQLAVREARLLEAIWDPKSAGEPSSARRRVEARIKARGGG